MKIAPAYIRQLMKNYSGKQFIFFSKKLLWNFSWHLTPMEVLVSRMEKILERYNSQMTFFTVANLIEKNPERLKIFKGHSIQPHGYSHIQYSKMTYHEAFKDIKKAVDIFKQNDIKIEFFRAPYATPSLSDGNNWYAILESLKIPFSSSMQIAVENSIPYPAFKNVLEVPITGPTDDILIDYQEIRDHRIILKEYINIIKRGIKSESLINLCFHPLRMGHNSYVGITERLLEVIDRWKDVELDSLSNALKRKHEGEKTTLVAMTGDIDCWDFSDYVKRLKY